jgi:uncharacterized protein (TIGR02246 family)
VRTQLLLLFLSILSVTRTARAGDDMAEAVRSELAREAAAWNKGDLDGYLRGYERAATTTMVGKDVYRGFDAIAAMYHKHYDERAKMGQLRFSELDVRPLGDGYAFAVGRWDLTRSAAAGGAAGGWFTLTLHRGAGGWHIVVDHTS